jgi:hypothetical protein
MMLTVTAIELRHHCQRLQVGVAELKYLHPFLTEFSMEEVQ